MIVRSGNKSQSILSASKYRNDVVSYSEDEVKFSFKEAMEFNTKWKQITEEELSLHSNTRKKYKLTNTLGVVTYHEFRDDELVDYCKSIEPKGNFFKIQGQHYFVVKKGKESIPMFVIHEVRSIPKMLENKTITASEREDNVKNYTEIEAEVV